MSILSDFRRNLNSNKNSPRMWETHCMSKADPEEVISWNKDSAILSSIEEDADEEEMMSRVMLWISPSVMEQSKMISESKADDLMVKQPSETEIHPLLTYKYWLLVSKS